MTLEVISIEPEEKRFETPLLFVHGAWHGAWCWAENFLPYFTERGFAVHALSLRGHGNSSGRERLRWTRAQEYVADIHEAASQLSVPPIILAHSMGAYVTQKYMEKYPVPAAVFIAPVPVKGVLRTTLNVARHHPLLFLRLNLKMSLYTLLETEALTREYLFSADMPSEQVRRYFRQVQEESYLGFLDMLVLNLPKPNKVPETPMLVVGGDNDAIFTANEFKETAEVYGADLELYPGMTHNIMLEAGWEAVAERIVTWLRPHSANA